MSATAIEELSNRRQWVTWNLEPPLPGSTKPRKVLKRPDNGANASSTDPDSWGTLDDVLAARERDGYTGIGYVFAADDPYVGVDLDGCRDKDTQEIDAWAIAIAERLDSYTEVSPSGTGLHIIVRGSLPAGRRRRGAIEMYSEGRYFTFTGDHLADTPDTLEERTTELAALHAEVLAEPERVAVPSTPRQSVPADDVELVQRMLTSKSGAAITRLWSGDSGGYDSQSSADLALCNHLAWWTDGDAKRMDTLFRQSGLVRDKWDERHRGDGATYGEMTISVAIGGMNTRPARMPDRTPTPIRPAVAEGPLSAAEIVLTPRPGFPEPLEECAFRGLAGEFVRLIEPHTEADPVALLGQFLVAYGNVIGRSAHFVAEADRHYTNLFICLVGETAKGRKGSSLGQVKRLFVEMEPRWVDERIQEGQSSGEGLIWAVRDPIVKRVAVMDKKRPTGEYRDEQIDDGVSDKRLLAAESEFASLLRVLEREGNTLSAVLRQAWDSGSLRALTKNAQGRATGAHISEIGHITSDELHRYLLRTEVANGLGNRYLWICVRRSKVLPDGGESDRVDMSGLLTGLHEAVEFGAQAGELRRDPEARDLWHSVYEELSSGKPGMFGALTARAEAQVMRLAVVYALLDLSSCVKRVHLEAALAFWRYCEGSVHYVFGSEVGDPVADTILSASREGTEGISRTEISQLFGRNRSADEIGRALSSLVSKGLVEMVKVNTGGRPSERYVAR